MKYQFSDALVSDVFRKVDYLSETPSQDLPFTTNGAILVGTSAAGLEGRTEAKVRAQLTLALGGN